MHPNNMEAYYDTVVSAWQELMSRLLNLNTVSTIPNPQLTCVTRGWTQAHL